MLQNPLLVNTFWLCFLGISVHHSISLKILGHHLRMLSLTVLLSMHVLTWSRAYFLQHHFVSTIYYFYSMLPDQVFVFQMDHFSLRICALLGFSNMVVISVTSVMGISCLEKIRCKSVISRNHWSHKWLEQYSNWLLQPGSFCDNFLSHLVFLKCPTLMQIHKLNK